MRRSRPHLRLTIVSIILALFAFPPGAVHAQAPFAPPNPHQQACIDAFPPSDGTAPWVGDLTTLEDFNDLDNRFESWVVENYGSTEAFAAASEKARHESSLRKIAMLRPAVDAGHLPSRLLMSQYWNRSYDIPGLLTPEERAATNRILYEGGFPLAGKPLPPPYKNGFDPEPPAQRQKSSKKGRKGKRHALPKPRPTPEAKTNSLKEAAANRLLAIEAIEWGAVRGNTDSWKSLAALHGRMVDEWEGGVEHRIEQFAWLELDKRLWREHDDRDEFNVLALEQLEVEKAFENESDRGRAIAPADQYVRELWPRRIITSGNQDICRLRPQFATDPDPYGDQQGL